MKQPRLLVLTDISSLTAGVGEPDDGQSMIRLMLYSNDFDIEGLVASSNMRHGQVVKPELIRSVVQAYAQVYPNLLLHSASYPSPDKLMSCVKSGQPVAGRDVPLADSIGEDKDTEGSNWIIAAGDKPDPRPLWITIWGGSADLAQALWRVAHTRSAADTAAFISRLRVYAIGDQDSTATWIKTNFPALFYITSGYGMRGMYRGGDTRLVSPEWVDTHIRHGHGALGALYPNYNGGDIWSRTVRGIKEGDTPSYLALIPNGLNDATNTVWQPEWGGWGGRFQRVADESANQFTDAVDETGSTDDLSPYMSAIHRWRPAYQADFQARLDWCVTDVAETNHRPVVAVAGEPGLQPVYISADAGATVRLDAEGTYDPDGDALNYRWWIYREAGTYPGIARIVDCDHPQSTVQVPPDFVSGQTIHVILEVTDNGEPALTSYRRVIVCCR